MTWGAPGKTELGPGERHLLPLALLALAISSPLVSVLSKNPGFFQAHGLQGWNALALLALLLLLPLLAHGLFLVLERATGRAMFWPEVLLGCWLCQWPGLEALSPLLALLAACALALIFFKALLDLPRLRLAALVSLLVYLAWQSLTFLASPELSKVLDFRSPVQPLRSLQLKNPPPIVFWLFDEFPVNVLMRPDGTIDSDQFPAFAELAAGSTWYRVARAIAGETLQAVPPLLSGTRQARKGGESVLTLFRETHQTVVLDPEVSLAPVSPDLSPHRLAQSLSDLGLVYLHVLAPRGLKPLLPAVDQGWVHFGRSENRYAEAMAALDLVRQEGDKPLFYFRHTTLPHGPYRYREGPRLALPGALPESGESVRDGFASFYLQARAADTVLGELIARLKREGLWDACLFVVVADHGRTFLPGVAAREESGEAAYGTFYVPLFLKAPRQRQGEVVDSEVSLLDILPTILDILGAPAPWPMDGRVTSPTKEPSPVLARLMSLAKEKYERYDLGPDTSVFCPPLLASWWKKPVPSSASTATGIDYELLTASDLSSVDLTAPALPLDLEARVHCSGPQSPGLLAWTVHGELVAATPWNGCGKPTTFFLSSPIPESALRQGANPVELFLVSGKEPEALRWSRIETRHRPTYRLDPARGVVLRQGQEQASLEGPGTALKVMPLASGGWRLQLLDPAPGATELLLFWSTTGELRQALPLDGTALTLSLPEPAQPEELRAFLVFAKGVRAIPWQKR